MPGQILHLYIKRGHGLPMQEVASVVAIAGRGLEGDASFGRASRQVLLVDQSILDEFALEPGRTRENIVVAGLRLTDLPAGTRLRVGHALLEVTGDCSPCDMMDSIRPGLREAIRGKRGLLARVLEGGTIDLQDAIAVEQAIPG